MIFITLTNLDGTKININIDAIGYFQKSDEDSGAAIYITGGTGGMLFVSETPETIAERLREAGEAEFV